MHRIYSDVTDYKTDGFEIYTTMDSKLKSLFPVTLLIELGSIRATPLGQFMDFDIGGDDNFKYVLKNWGFSDKEIETAMNIIKDISIFIKN